MAAWNSRAGNFYVKPMTPGSCERPGAHSEANKENRDAEAKIRLQQNSNLVPQKVEREARKGPADFKKPPRGLPETAGIDAPSPSECRKVWNPPKMQNLLLA